MGRVLGEGFEFLAVVEVLDEVAGVVAALAGVRRGEVGGVGRDGVGHGVAGLE